MISIRLDDLAVFVEQELSVWTGPAGVVTGIGGMRQDLLLERAGCPRVYFQTRTDIQWDWPDTFHRLIGIHEPLEQGFRINQQTVSKAGRRPGHGGIGIIVLSRL